MSTSHPWGPTGVFPPVANPVSLSGDDWNEIRITFKKHMGQDAPADLRKALNDALYIYQAAGQALGSRSRWEHANYVSVPALPKRVRANLKLAEDAAIRLLERVNELDGNSRQLISKADEDGLKGLYDSIKRATEIINAARMLAKKYPKSRKDMISYPSHSLACSLARTVRDFCGEKKLAATRDGLYHRLLLVLFRALGEPSEDRVTTMKRALKAVREDGREEPSCDGKQFRRSY